MTSRILISRPSITQLEIDYVNDAVANGWGRNCFDYLDRFEREFSDYLGTKWACATSSATGALHLGLAALGVGIGDEVILADTNWIATAAPIVHMGATPVFVDINPSSWCIDPALVERAITPKTKAIICTHLYGNVCEMDRLLAVGLSHNIPIIEDAAEALGSQWKGHNVGSLGIFGIFSFHGTKTLTTGEGGMIVTNSDQLYEKILTLSNHGRARSERRKLWPGEIGYKFKMSNVQAALGCAQLSRLDQLVRRKIEILNLYQELLGDLPNLRLNSAGPDERISAWMTTVEASIESGITAAQLAVALDGAGIDTRPFFYPLTSLPMFGGDPLNPNAMSVHHRALNVPSYHDLTSDEISEVAEAIKRVLRDSE